MRFGGATVVVFLVVPLLIAFVSGQAQGQNKDEKHDASTVLTLTDNNWIQEIMHKGEKTHMFVLFENLTCQECRRYGTVMAKLAKHTEGAPQIARANC